MVHKHFHNVYESDGGGFNVELFVFFEEFPYFLVLKFDFVFFFWKRIPGTAPNYSYKKLAKKRESTKLNETYAMRGHGDVEKLREKDKAIIKRIFKT